MRINKARSKIKKTLTTLIATSLLASITTVTAFAGSGIDNGNANGGGAVNAGNDPVYAHKFMAYIENQGYRISIVDTDGMRVANSVDIVNYVPSYLWNGALDGKVSDYKAGFNQYRNYVGWGTGDKVSQFVYSYGVKSEDYTDQTWRSDKIPYYTNKYGRIETEMYPIQNFEGMFELYYNSVASEIGAGEFKSNSFVAGDRYNNYLGGGDFIPLPTVVNDGILEAGGADFKAFMQSQMIGTKGNAAVASVMANMMVAKRDSKGDSTGSMDYLFKFADSSLQSLVGTKDSAGNVLGVASIIASKGYKFTVEPLYWYVPEILSNDPVLIQKSDRKDMHIGQVNAVCYGTVSYIAKFVEDALRGPSLKYTDSQLKTVWTGPDWGSSGLGITTLMVARDDTAMGIKEPSAAGLHPTIDIGSGVNTFNLYDLASNNSFKTIGYGLHIYDGTMLGESSVSTSTYDSVNYPSTSYEEGPAPEPPTQSEGDDYKNAGKDHKKNIVKFYGEKDSSGNIVYTANYVRENTVSTIDIVNEGNYKVDNYFISPQFKAPSSQSDSYDTFKGGLSKSR